jgi:hypothetical protein
MVHQDFKGSSSVIEDTRIAAANDEAARFFAERKMFRADIAEVSGPTMVA